MTVTMYFNTNPATNLIIFEADNRWYCYNDNGCGYYTADFCGVDLIPDNTSDRDALGIVKEQILALGDISEMFTSTDELGTEIEDLRGLDAYEVENTFGEFETLNEICSFEI